MRTFSLIAGSCCLLLAAIISGGADDRDAGKRPPPPVPGAKNAARAATKPAPGAIEKNGARTPPKDKAVEDDKPAPEKALAETDEAEAPDKYVEDRAAILETAVKFIDAYSERDAGAIASLFAPDAEYIDEQGTTFRGRDEIEQNLKIFFEGHPAATLEMHIESLRFLTPEVAIEDGSSTCICEEGGSRYHSRYTVVHAKVDGKWLVASSRESVSPGQPRHAAHLKQLDWLLGEWIDQDDDSVVQFECAGSEDGRYLLRNFTISVGREKVITGTQRMGWDPASGALKSWTFDSDGGHFEGAWHRDDEKWYLSSSGITSDGRHASGTAVYTPINAHTMTWQLVNREIGGVHLPDSDEFTLVRTAPAPEK